MSHARQLSASNGVCRMSSLTDVLTCMDVLIEEELNLPVSAFSCSSFTINDVISRFAKSLGKFIKIAAELGVLNNRRKKRSTSITVEDGTPLSSTTMDVRLLSKPSVLDKDCNKSPPVPPSGVLIAWASSSANKHDFRMRNATAFPLRESKADVLGFCSREKNATTAAKPPESTKCFRKAASSSRCNCSNPIRCSIGRMDKAASAGFNKASIVSST
mmetsp:Transcript_20178/g.42256  ORF Transcript_20178/g.42256 Transcript_20178/m.42256 type:complete len:216 (+) Transcript_20178:913-1560(+)